MWCIQATANLVCSRLQNFLFICTFLSSSLSFHFHTNHISPHESHPPLSALFLPLSLSCRKFYVGGRDGWVLMNPFENYNHGQKEMDFKSITFWVIMFKFQKGWDSVLEMNKEDYDKCNTKNPIKKFEDGDTEFRFDGSGPFFFQISRL